MPVDRIYSDAEPDDDGDPGTWDTYEKQLEASVDHFYSLVRGEFLEGPEDTGIDEVAKT